MIFVILGTQKFQFNRLLEEVDKLIENGDIKEEVFAQIGYSTYKPKNYNYKQFVDIEDFKTLTKDASLIITHAGTGAIITSLRNGKKVIALPRLAKFGEHVDDHQKQISNVMKKKGYIESIEDIDELKEVLKVIPNKTYLKYISNNEKIINIIETFIDTYSK